MKDSGKHGIRPMKLDEIHKAVSIHQAAFPFFFLTFMGPSFLSLLYRFYIQGPTEIALTGKYKGQMVATLLGTTKPKGFYKRLATRYCFVFALASLKPLLRRPSILPRLFRALFYRGDVPNLGDGGALLASVCVDPNFQKMGIGKRIIGSFENRIWKRGAKFVYLSTDLSNNKEVLTFYEKNGWAIESEIEKQQGRILRVYLKKAPLKLEGS